jgi:hypothetical protein
MDRLSSGPPQHLLASPHFPQLIHVHKQTIHVRRIQILNLRLAIIVPIYAILFYLILMLPQYWSSPSSPPLPSLLLLLLMICVRSYFDAAINLVEGYCIFAFYKMLQLNVGGPSGTIQMIQTSEHTAPCYATCQQKCPRQCNSLIHFLLVQFMTLRPLMFLFIAILEEHPERWDKLIRLLTALCIISLILAMIALLRVYHVLGEHAMRLRPTVKVLFVKGIVFILVVQELIIASFQKTGIFQTHGEDLEHRLVSTSSFPSTRLDLFSLLCSSDTVEFDHYRQYYALAGLCEMLLLTFTLKPVFAINMEEDEDHKSDKSASNLTQDAPDYTPVVDESFSSFVCAVFSVWTIVFSDEHDNQKSTQTVAVEIPNV